MSIIGKLFAIEHNRLGLNYTYILSGGMDGHEDHSVSLVTEM